MGHIFPLPGEEDDRTPEEEARDLGILPERLVITNVQWICNARGNRESFDVRVCICSLSFSRRVHQWLGTNHVIPSVGKATGIPVLIIKPASVHDKRGYKISTARGRPVILNKRLMNRLLVKGLPQGNYELRKYDSYFVAVPVKVK